MRPNARLDGGRLLRAVVLAAWAAFFAYLYVSGEISRYLGPRTYWVVPFGAAALGGAAAAHFFTLRTERGSSGLRLREILGHAVLLAPVIAVLAVPAPELGALAAGKKSTGGGLAGVSSIVPPDPSGREVSFLEIHYANESQEFADAMGIVDGYDISLAGFVSRAEAGTFELTRFYVSCCAADAIPYSVSVVEGPDLPIDSWVQVSGHLEERESRFVLVAEDLERIGEPKDPYLY
jgi:uncharacterized repeat protein (TIGR03943 family)